MDGRLGNGGEHRHQRSATSSRTSATADETERCAISRLAVRASRNPTPILSPHHAIASAKLRPPFRFFEEIDLLLKEGVTDDELDAAKQGLLQGEQVDRTEDDKLTAIIEESLDANRTLKYQADLEERVMKATPDDVVKACRKYLDPSRLVIVTAGDFRAKEGAAASSDEK